MSTEGHVRHFRRVGFTLVEIIISLTVLVMAMLGFLATFVVSANSYHDLREDSIAVDALRAVAEAIRGASFPTAAATYQGYTFTVDEIGATGRVDLYLDETDSGPEAALLGLPRDLDGDGAPSSHDVSTGYILLPIKIGVTWPHAGGARTKVLYTLLAQETS